MSLAVIAFATLLPQPSGPPLRSNFCLVCGSLGGVNAVLNVMLFVPLGIGLAVSGFSAKRAVIVVCVLAALIESAQFFVIPGRYSTIGDVLSNTLGGALGFAIARYATALRRPSPRIGLALSTAWIAVWLAIQAASAFGFAPAFPRSDYYGQIAPQLGNFEPFTGSVLRARIADVAVTDTVFPDSRKVRRLLRRGAIVTTTIALPRPTRGIAPIVRVADARHREIVLLAQSADNLIFGVRTGAAVLHLRPPLFAMRDAFRAEPPGESRLTPNTLTVGARYSAREVWVDAQTGAGHDRRIPITASLGWTMLLPFQWFIEGTNTEFVLSAIWTMSLLVPIGYWAGGVLQLPRGQNPMRIRLMALPIASVLLYVGLVAVPRAFGLTAAPITDWLAALTGILLGRALAGFMSARDTKVGRVQTD